MLHDGADGAGQRATALFGRLVGEDSDPRGPQLALLVPIALDLLFRIGAHWAEAFSATAFAGWAVVAVATVGALLIAAGRLPATATVALPVLDVAGLGLLRMTDGSPIALAVVFPAVWLGLQLAGRGVAIALVATLLAMIVPGFAIEGTNTSTVSRGALVLLVAGMCAGVVAVASRRWEAQREVLEQARHEAEVAVAALTLQRRVQEAIVASVDVGLVSLDAVGRYTSMNPRHRDFMELAYPDGHHGVAGQLGAVYAEDGATELTEPTAMPSWRAAQGEEFEDSLIWVGADPRARRALAVSARSVRGPGGELTGAVLAYHDVTDLISALRARDEFVATVSHELRTPLTSIVGYLDIVDNDIEGLPDQAREYLGAAVRNAERLIRLVSDLLQVGQHAAGVAIDPVETDLAAVVAECVANAGTRAAEAGVDLSAHCPGPVDVLADVSRLRQLLDNLLSNAIKYTPSGGSVRVALAAGADHVDIEVLDTGIGIAEDEVEHLFTRFFRAREAQRRAIPGVGLGLSICKDIVDAHGGTIEVESEPDAGTRVQVRLPRRPG